MTFPSVRGPENAYAITRGLFFNLAKYQRPHVWLAVHDAPYSSQMSADNPDITNHVDMARLAFSADGVIDEDLDLTWDSYVDVADDGTITVDVYPDHNPIGEHDTPNFRYRIDYLGPAPDRPAPGY